MRHGLLSLSVLSSLTFALGQNSSRLHHGLTGKGISLNGISLGALPDWSREGPADINRALGAPIALIGDYVGVQNSSTSFGQFRWHLSDLVEQSKVAVYAPAILPYFSLASWTQAQSNALASAAATLNSAGVTVWLRFAYEMNGAWMAYGLDPTNFVAAFRNVAAAVRANSGCTKTYMLWSPNIAGGGENEGYQPYWPGADVVDIAGLSFYWSGTNQSQNTMPGKTSFSDAFQSFHDLYGSQVPIVISETSAQYHYEIPSGFTALGNDQEIQGTLPNITTMTPVPSSSPSELSMKQEWLLDLTSASTAAQFPNLTAVSLFNYFKEGQDQLLDFRWTGGNPAVETFVRSYAGNVTAYNDGYDGAAPPRWAPTAFIFVVVPFSALSLA